MPPFRALWRTMKLIDIRAFLQAIAARVRLRRTPKSRPPVSNTIWKSESKIRKRKRLPTARERCRKYTSRPHLTKLQVTPSGRITPVQDEEPADATPEPVPDSPAFTNDSFTRAPEPAPTPCKNPEDRTLHEYPSDELHQIMLGHQDHAAIRRAELDLYRSDYAVFRRRHLAGEDPDMGVVWDPTWSQLEFDHLHLLVGMQMTGQILQWEQYAREAKGELQRRGCQWVEQGSRFGSEDGVYPDGVERRLIERTPRDMIESWRLRVACEVEDGDQQELVEYAKEPVPLVLDRRPIIEPEPWESWSMLSSDGVYRRRVEAYRPGGRSRESQVWTWNEDVERHVRGMVAD